MPLEGRLLAYLVMKKNGEIPSKFIPPRFVFRDTEPESHQSLDLNMVEITSTRIVSRTPLFVGKQRSVSGKRYLHLAMDVEYLEGFDRTARRGNKAFFLLRHAK